MKIGVISDTHNYFDPRIPEIFQDVEHILHAGDIGRRSILAELELIAPVTAVSGNTDDDPAYRPTAVVMLAGRKFLVHHIVTPGHVTQPIYQRISDEAPAVVVFGHTHKPFAKTFGPVLFFNPGYAGKSRFAMDRSVAILECDATEVQYRFVALAG